MNVKGWKSYQVYRWMHDELHISGARELIFAVIYKCTQEEGEYTGSANELAQLIGYQSITVSVNLKALTESEYLLKRYYTDKRYGVRRCAYRVNPEIVKGV